jgi:hypothetical protein
MLVFLAITIQIGHCIRDKLTDYWAKTNQFYTRFYSSAFYTSHITIMTLILRTKILTGYGRCKYVWNSKQDIFKKPFWTSGCRRSYCFIQTEGHFSTIRGDTQKFGEFKQRARTGCIMPFRLWVWIAVCWSNCQWQVLLCDFEGAEGGHSAQTSRQVEEHQLVSPPWQRARSHITRSTIPDFQKH